MKMDSHRFISMLIGIIAISCIFSLLPVAHAVGDDEYYSIKLVVKTDSDWTKIEPLPPWDTGWIITDSKIVEPEKDQHLIHLDKLGMNSPPFDDSYKIIEFIVYFKARPEDLKFTITKGDIGSTRVEAYNLCSDEPYRIGTYTNSDRDSTGTNLNKFKMPIRKISKYGTVHLTPPRK